MRMQKNSGRNGGTEVLGTMSAIHAPQVQDFQFVKFRTTGEGARLTLDRPEHNLLNERMLAEVAAGINSLSERSEVKLIVMDSAGKAFSGGIELGEYTQRRVFQLLDAFHNAFSAMLDTSKPVLVVINGCRYSSKAVCMAASHEFRDLVRLTGIDPLTLLGWQSAARWWTVFLSILILLPLAALCRTLACR